MTQTRSIFRILIAVLAGVVIAAVLSSFLNGTIAFSPTANEDLITRLMSLALIALLVERSVEVYLLATEQNGPDRHDPNTILMASATNAKRPASIAGFTIGVLIAFSGVQVLDAVFTLNDGDTLSNGLLRGVDIIITAGLLAGGSTFIHEIVETLFGAIKNLNSMLTPANRDANRAYRAQLNNNNNNNSPTNNSNNSTPKPPQDNQ